MDSDVLQSLEVDHYVELKFDAKQAMKGLGSTMVPSCVSYASKFLGLTKAYKVGLREDHTCSMYMELLEPPFNVERKLQVYIIHHDVSARKGMVALAELSHDMLKPGVHCHVLFSDSQLSIWLHALDKKNWFKDVDHEQSDSYQRSKGPTFDLCAT